MEGCPKLTGGQGERGICSNSWSYFVRDEVEDVVGADHVELYTSCLKVGLLPISHWEPLLGLCRGVTQSDLCFRRIT